ncbi:MULTISPECIES: hypothetical protein [Halomonas]|nr:MULTISPECIES: hypothetical protein [Halomonas]MDR5902234.1 hypothetical protein [Halomonas icarae]
MKQQTPRKAMGERDKLRQFRELDDAFAEALRALDATPAAESAAELALEPSEAEDMARVTTVPEGFEKRLEALMAEYDFSSQRVRELLETLQHFESNA